MAKNPRSIGPDVPDRKGVEHNSVAPRPKLHRPFRRFISIAKIEAMTRAMPAA
jgi:hypothetical protein